MTKYNVNLEDNKYSLDVEGIEQTGKNEIILDNDDDLTKIY